MHDRSITGDLKVGTRRMDNASGDREVLTPYQLPVVRYREGSAAYTFHVLDSERKSVCNIELRRDRFKGPTFVLSRREPPAFRPVGMHSLPCLLALKLGWFDCVFYMAPNYVFDNLVEQHGF